MTNESPGHMVIRADSSVRMGSGHLMRTLALAQAWRDAGGHATFVSRCESASIRQRIQVEQCEYVELTHTDDLDCTLRALDSIGADIVVLDGYHFDAQYQKAIKSTGVRLLVVDDYMHSSHYWADFLLNQNLDASARPYVIEDYTRLLLGPRYALLRREFAVHAAAIRAIPDIAHHLLVTLGGSDPDNVTLRVIQAIKQIDLHGLEAIVVVGGANPHFDTLERAIAGTGARVDLVRDTLLMSELMRWADLAVSAGGTTCWEMACMGLPNLILVLADNQSAVARESHRAGLSWSLGDAANLSTPEIAQRIRTLLIDSRARGEMSLRGPSLVDGRGAERVVNVLAGRDGDTP